MQVVLAAEPVLREPKYVAPAPCLDQSSLIRLLSSLFPYRWSSSETPSPAKHLRIGYFLDDGVVAPTPPVIRGMQAVLNAVKGLADVDLVEFTPIEPEENWNVAVSSLSPVAWTQIAESLRPVLAILLRWWAAHEGTVRRNWGTSTASHRMDRLTSCCRASYTATVFGGRCCYQVNDGVVTCLLLPS